MLEWVGNVTIKHFIEGYACVNLNTYTFEDDQVWCGKLFNAPGGTDWKEDDGVYKGTCKTGKLPDHSIVSAHSLATRLILDSTSNSTLSRRRLSVMLTV